MIHHESTNIELPSAFSAFVEFWTETDTTFFQVILQRVWWFEASWMVRKDKRERLCSLHVGGDAALSATWRRKLITFPISPGMFETPLGVIESQAHQLGRMGYETDMNNKETRRFI